MKEGLRHPHLDLADRAPAFFSGGSLSLEGALVFSYGLGLLALALLVARVLADHHHATVTTNDLALVADLLNARVNLHAFTFYL